MSHRLLPISASVCLTLLSACQVAPADENGEDATSESDDSPTDETGDGDVCEPRDPAVAFDSGAWDFTLEDPSEDAADIDWTCTISEVDASEGLHLLLDCPESEQPVEFNLVVTPGFAVPLSGAETILIRYVREPQPAGGSTQYLRLDVDGQGHLLTWIYSSTLVPDDTPFELPLPIERVASSCPLIPEFCGDATRQVMSFEFEGQPAEVLDGRHEALGGPTGTEMWVFESWEVPKEENTCTDASPVVNHVLIVDTILQE